jgi:hypothetical protein
MSRSCFFVSPFLLERIAASSHEAADRCRLTLARDQELRAADHGSSLLTQPSRARSSAAVTWRVVQG